jgi:hypothetical protein
MSKTSFATMNSSAFMWCINGPTSNPTYSLNARRNSSNRYGEPDLSCLFAAQEMTKGVLAKFAPLLPYHMR